MALQDTPTAGKEIKPEKMDPKEQAERETAARAYAGETPQHFVDYCMDCVDISVKAMLDIRQMQEECWRVFNEEEPDNWGMKELWMSRITYPKPNKLVRVGQAFARQAFDVDFLSIENEKDKEAADFWTQFMGLMVTRNYANFPTNFADATAMALAIGTSMEIIPRWNTGKGMELILANPENIHRDPVAESRQPWSGRYWVHQEWMPFYALKQGEKDGLYENIQDFSVGGGWISSPQLTEEEIARRKNMIHVQGAFNPSTMVSEIWGIVLSPRGEMLLPQARYTVAANQVIKKPEASPYQDLRWPGVGFSALPNLRRFDGRGLIQGIRSLWYFANNLLSLHADNLNWVVNPMIEMNTDDMMNPMDNDLFPGKIILTFRSQSGQQIVRTIDRNTQNSEIIAMLSKADMIIDDGGLLDRTIQGSPGYRSQVTKGEAAQNLEQSSTIMGSIAVDIEDGALNVIKAMAETVRANMTYDELNKWFPEYAEKYRAPVSTEHPTGLDLPKLSSGNFKIAGISAFMKHQENLKNLKDMEEMFNNPVLVPFLEAYPYLKARVKYTNLVDIGMLVSEDKAKELMASQQAQQDAAIEQQKAKEAAEAQGAQAEADKHGAQAQEFATEAGKNVAQGDLYGAQAGAVPGGGAAPEAGAVPPAGAVPAPGGGGEAPAGGLQ
jgi:hypothetical protein